MTPPASLVKLVAGSELRALSGELAQGDAGWADPKGVGLHPLSRQCRCPATGSERSSRGSPAESIGSELRRSTPPCEVAKVGKTPNLQLQVSLRWTPHLILVTTRDESGIMVIVLESSDIPVRTTYRVGGPRKVSL